MTDDFSPDEFDSAERRKMRKMHHEWEEFKAAHMGPISSISWVVKNWKVLAFIFVVGAAGSIKNVLLAMKAWL